MNFRLLLKKRVKLTRIKISIKKIFFHATKDAANFNLVSLSLSLSSFILFFILSIFNFCFGPRYYFFLHVLIPRC
jgi:hypothetical protein